MKTPKKAADRSIEIEKLRAHVATLAPMEKVRRLEALFAKVNDKGMSDAEFRTFVVKTLSGEKSD